jgi:hypothetical protein
MKEFEDKYYLIREKFENFQYEVENQDFSIAALDSDIQDDAYVFGLEIKSKDE